MDLGQIKKDIHWIEWNGSLKKINGTGKVILGHAPSGTFEKTLRKHGTFKSVFFEPFAIVYGTQGNDNSENEMLRSAKAIGYRFWRVGNGYSRILADSEVDPTLMAQYNLILLGSPSNNSVMADLLPQTPAVVDAEFIELDGLRVEGELSLAMVYPNPRYPEKMVAFFTGNSPDAERRALSFLPIYSGSGTPHYVIFGKEVKQYAWGGVRNAGFFNQDGKLDP